MISGFTLCLFILCQSMNFDAFKTQIASSLLKILNFESMIVWITISIFPKVQAFIGPSKEGFSGLLIIYSFALLSSSSRTRNWPCPTIIFKNLFCQNILLLKIKLFFTFVKYFLK